MEESLRAGGCWVSTTANLALTCGTTRNHHHQMQSKHNMVACYAGLHFCSGDVENSGALFECSISCLAKSGRAHNITSPRKESPRGDSTWGTAKGQGWISIGWLENRSWVIQSKWIREGPLEIRPKVLCLVKGLSELCFLLEVEWEWEAPLFYKDAGVPLKLKRISSDHLLIATSNPGCSFSINHRFCDCNHRKWVSW